MRNTSSSFAIIIPPQFWLVIFKAFSFGQHISREICAGSAAFTD
ncbi:hypothetical protein L248_1880 [Schleiferilactobacillus shenzhenensis LY-73]|uniref:Uncharacterized protein n=1 Tax=Schleiferilactobacillus shenzhenensis LY-73 TaxID=1231336 RepID=U4TNM3_9LACO|nr:hypothetical protein L248_1880 [Schleiferilactobacillus shenzhenensis LY-73]